LTSIIFKMSSTPNHPSAVGTPPDLEKASTPPPTHGTGNDSDSKLHVLTKSRSTELSVNDEADAVPPLKGLSLLDRFLVLWIILAMAIGILLGSLVPSTGPALQKGKFVGVSIPIGELPVIPRWLINR
jgi:ACR3 family arsenite transporter